MEKMMMPAYYNVLSTEEMTYTEGGACHHGSRQLLRMAYPLRTAGSRALLLSATTASKNPNNWTETGLDALTARTWRRALPTPCRMTSPAPLTVLSAPALPCCVA